MGALEGDFFYGKNFSFCLAVAEEDLALADEDSGGNFGAAAEVQNWALGAAGQRVRSGIVGIEDAEIGCVLILENAGFGFDVGFEGAVAVEMIRRDIEDRRNEGAKRLDSFELKAGDFEDYERLGRGLVDQ